MAKITSKSDKSVAEINAPIELLLDEVQNFITANNIQNPNVTFSNEEIKQFKRNKITTEVGDTNTLLGVMADNQTILLDLACINILSINEEQDSTTKANQINQITDLYNIDWDQIVIKAREWVTKRKNHDIKTTTSLKGLDTIFNDIATTSTKVTNVLSKTSDELTT